MAYLCQWRNNRPRRPRNAGVREGWEPLGPTKKFFTDSISIYYDSEYNSER